MTNIPTLSRLNPLRQALAWGWQAVTGHHWHGKWPNMHQLVQNPNLLPCFVNDNQKIKKAQVGEAFDVLGFR